MGVAEAETRPRLRSLLPKVDCRTVSSRHLSSFARSPGRGRHGHQSHDLTCTLKCLSWADQGVLKVVQGWFWLVLGALRWF